MNNMSTLPMRDMSLGELKDIQGGWWQQISAVAGAAAAVITVAYEAGEAVGEAIYHATH